MTTPRRSLRRRHPRCDLYIAGASAARKFPAAAPPRAAHTLEHPPMPSLRPALAAILLAAATSPALATV
ncbi:MAG: hypothetical protein ACO396_05320, partial [Phycisphaerales bacterium]